MFGNIVGTFGRFSQEEKSKHVQALEPANCYTVTEI
jgi:hypothetical protein